MGGEGGRIGPALDRIASRRAPEFIMESILQPSKDIAPEYEAVAVATKDGRVITGLRVNETNFSIQLHEENGRFHSFLKRDLEEVKVMKKSLMPENFAELLDRQGAARPVRVLDDVGVTEKKQLRSLHTQAACSARAVYPTRRPSPCGFLPRTSLVRASIS